MRAARSLPATANCCRDHDAHRREFRAVFEARRRSLSLRARRDTPVPLHPAASDAHRARPNEHEAARPRRFDVSGQEVFGAWPGAEWPRLCASGRCRSPIPRRIFRDGCHQGQLLDLASSAPRSAPCHRRRMCCCITTWARSMVPWAPGAMRGAAWAPRLCRRVSRRRAARFALAPRWTRCRRTARRPASCLPAARRFPASWSFQRRREAHLPQASRGKRFPISLCGGVKNFKIRGCVGQGEHHVAAGDSRRCPRTRPPAAIFLHRFPD